MRKKKIGLNCKCRCFKNKRMRKEDRHWLEQNFWNLELKKVKRESQNLNLLEIKEDHFPA